LHTTHFYPRAILSLPVAELLEINLSHTRYVFMDNEGWVPYAFSLGLAIGRKGGNIIRPEIGILVFPEDNDVLQFGIGYTPEAPNRPPASGLEEGTPY